jgi:hypothetical protein
LERFRGGGGSTGDIVLLTAFDDRFPNVFTLPRGRNGEGDEVVGLAELTADQLDCDEMDVRLVVTGVAALEDYSEG